MEKIAKGHSASGRVAGKVDVLNLVVYYDGMRHNRVCMYTPRQCVNGPGTGTLQKVFERTIENCAKYLHLAN
jgi:hypothetical protein